jgi:hypothetical protein
VSVDGGRTDLEGDGELDEDVAAAQVRQDQQSVLGWGEPAATGSIPVESSGPLEC